MNANNRNLFSDMIRAAAEASDVMADEFSPQKRPYARAFIYFSTLVIMILGLPFIIPFKLLKKKMVDPFAKMRTEIETIWYTESRTKALLQLREIYLRLISDINTVVSKGIQIDPWGKFGHDEYCKLSHMLCHWESQQSNWNKAIDICDNILSHHSMLDHKKSDFLANWIILKAKILKEIEGSLSAQEFLLKYVDPNDKDSSINNYLYELREVK